MKRLSSHDGRGAKKRPKIMTQLTVNLERRQYCVGFWSEAQLKSYHLKKMLGLFYKLKKLFPNCCYKKLRLKGNDIDWLWGKWQVGPINKDFVLSAAFFKPYFVLDLDYKLGKFGLIPTLMEMKDEAKAVAEIDLARLSESADEIVAGLDKLSNLLGFKTLDS